VPAPVVLSADTAPSCASSVCRTMASPSPVPPGLCVKYGSQIRGSRSCGIPTPPGMDEISPLGSTQVIEIREGRMHEWTIDPATFGMGVGRAEELAGGPPADNAAAVRAVLADDAPPTARAAVLLNAAAAVFVSTSGTKSFGEAVEVARAALEQGAGLAALERLRVAFASTAS
jgi:anthranilate phosphoribosyltransferase